METQEQRDLKKEFGKLMIDFIFANDELEEEPEDNFTKRNHLHCKEKLMAFLYENPEFAEKLPRLTRKNLKKTYDYTLR
jgi:hypothetical protein